MEKHEVTVDKDGTIRFHKPGTEELHRFDGPAVESPEGTKHWYVDGKRHRLDGPAIEHANGTKFWYVDGKRHRLDGPAVEWADGDKSWFIDGVKLTEYQFNERDQLQLFS